MTWQSFLFLPVAGVAFGYSGFKLLTLFRLMKGMKGQGPSVKQIASRLVETFVNVLGQKAVLQKKWAGLIHATIFWGFIIITVGTLEQFLSTLHSGFHLEIIGETPFQALVFLQDIFTFLVLAAVLAAAYRRFIVRPEHLGQSMDANLILLFTGALMVSIFLMNAFYIIGKDPWYQTAMPLSAVVASALTGISADPATNVALGDVFKWVHMLIVLGFGMYIPSSKHLHVLAAGPNTFLKNLGREKGLKPINFEDESIEQYGAGKITDLSWKDALDYYSCTECGRCQELCPAHNTQKPLSPKNIIKDLKNNMFQNKDKILAGQYEEVSSVMDANVTEDVIWACTSCRACEVACPVFIQQLDKIYEIRRNLVMMESKFPAEVQTVFKNMENNASPWAFPADDRANWTEGQGIKTVEQEPNFDVLLWVGCAGSFDDRNKKVLTAFTRILKKANVNFAILGKEEKCTGDPARRIGNEYLFQMLAKENVETLNRHNVKKIVTSCPHCFNILKNEYGDLGGNYEVVHHSQFIGSLIREGKIKPTKSLQETVTFHDSCYLGRWNDVYEAPRDALKAIPSLRLVEMKKSHDQSLCCGAGGGRMWMEETIGKRINVTRTEQALETKAGLVASGCPFCMTMITDGVKAKEVADKVVVKDIAELIDDATP